MTDQAIISDAEPEPKAAAGRDALLLAAAAALLLSPSLLYPFGRDQGVFTDVAQVILRGGTPYRDVWDIKPPGIYLVYTAIVGLFGPRIAAVRAVDLLCQSITVALLFGFGRRLVGREAAAIGALTYAAMYLHSGYWSMAQAEGFAALPTVAAFALALLAGRTALPPSGRYRTPLLLGAGLLCGWVALLKFTLALPCVAGVLWAGLTPRPPSLKGRGRLWPWRTVIPIAVGAGVPLVGALVYLQASGGWTAYMEIQRGFVAPYAHFAYGGESWWGRAWGGARAIVSAYGLPCLLAVIGAASIAFRRPERRALPLLGWLALTVAGVVVQGKYFGYHWIPAMMPLALLAGAGLRALSSWLLHGRWTVDRRPRNGRTGRPSQATLVHGRRSTVVGRRSSVVGLLCVALWTGVSDWPAHRDGWRAATGTMPRAEYDGRFGPPHMGDYSYLADQWVARHIRATTPPEDGIFLWGFEPLVYVLADRRPPTRFHFAVPLVAPGTPDVWRNELMRDLEARPPALFLVLRNDAIPWASGRADDSEAQLRRFPGLDRFLRRNYRFERRIEDFAVFRRAKITK